MQKFNYHTHCYRCGHATGNEEEYIQAAIEAGFETIGMSEHMGYDGWDDANERIPYLALDDYLQTMYALKEKYKDKINVRVGFECEFFEDSIAHLQTMKDKCDYLICGQHAPDRSSGYYDQHPYCEDVYMQKMADQVCKGIELGFFRYVAHPDYFMLSKCDWSEAKEKAIRQIAKCCKKYDAIMEINIKGTKYGRREYPNGESFYYPNREALQVVAEEGVKVCFGYDAHHPNILLNREIETMLKEEYKDINLVFEENLVM